MNKSEKQYKDEIIDKNSIFDEKSDGKKYSSKDDKLAHREMFYITHNQTADEGLNKMIETSKIETQLSLKLEEC